MARAHLNLNASRFMAASRNLAMLARTTAPRETLEAHMRQFVRNVISITPPAQGNLSQGKARGEAAILADLLSISQPVTVDGRVRKGELLLMTASDLLELHAASRDQSTGRVVAYGEARLVTQADFNAVLRGLLVLVGTLAAGWNAAANALAVSGVPAWIKRHGAKYGSVEVVASPTTLRISILNDVPFADNVQALQKRVNYALRMTAVQLEKGYEQALRRAARRSGFR